MPTTKTIINIHSRILTMTIMGEIVHFKVFESLHIPPISTINDCSYIGCVDSLVHNTFFVGKDRR